MLYNAVRVAVRVLKVFVRWLTAYLESGDNENITAEKGIYQLTSRSHYHRAYILYAN